MNYLTSLAKCYVATFALFLGITQLPTDLPRGAMAPIGIFPISDDQALLFVSVYTCQEGDDKTTTNSILSSSDGGRSWRSALQGLKRSTLEYVSAPRGGAVWVFGYEYEEGPASNPFVLVSGDSGLDWEVRSIYKGAAELEGVSLVDPHHLIAWVRHLKLSGKGWVGPVYIHGSQDGGRTWKQVGLAANYHGSKKGEGFAEIQKQVNKWRVRDLEEKPGGFVVERSSTNGQPWDILAAFPKQPCAGPASK